MYGDNNDYTTNRRPSTVSSDGTSKAGSIVKWAVIALVVFVLLNILFYYMLGKAVWDFIF
jgi:hypothetical protein